MGSEHLVEGFNCEDESVGQSGCRRTEEELAKLLEQQRLQLEHLFQEQLRRQKEFADDFLPRPRQWKACQSGEPQVPAKSAPAVPLSAWGGILPGCPEPENSFRTPSKDPPQLAEVAEQSDGLHVMHRVSFSDMRSAGNRAAKLLLTQKSLGSDNSDQTKSSKSPKFGMASTRFAAFMMASRCHLRLHSFVHSVGFRALVSVVIMANSLMIGIVLHVQLGDADREPDNMATKGFEWGFGCFFIVELILRFWADFAIFFRGPSRGWNFFDLLLVAHFVVDVGMELKGGNGTPNLLAVRMLRILRFGRILRLVRVIRIFESFRLMVFSILGSMVMLVWVFLVQLFLIYFFSIVFLCAVAEGIKDTSVSPQSASMLLKYFGGLDLALITLFKTISGGKEWGELMDLFTEVHWAYGLAFLLYIFFMVFGVLNVVTSIFVDKAQKISLTDQDFVIQDELARNAVYAKNISKLFHEADSDHSGMLSWAEFEDHLKDEHVQAYFATLELDVSQARALFILLDVDETNEVGIEEFVGGCMQLKGEARSIDVNMLLYENEKMMKYFAHFSERTLVSLDSIAQQLGVVLPEARKGPDQRSTRLRSRVPVECGRLDKGLAIFNS